MMLQFHNYTQTLTLNLPIKDVTQLICFKRRLSNINAHNLGHRRDGELTCVLLTDLLAGFRRPLAAEVLDPLRGGVGLVVEGELGRIQPVGDVQEAARAHHKTAS